MAIPTHASRQSNVLKIPTVSTAAGPRDAEWEQRLKEELHALITYIEMMKASDADWFSIKPSNKQGTMWSGTCWAFYDSAKYSFDYRVSIPATYPHAAPEIEIPELDGKTAKMYRGGAICVDVHFRPLWTKNAPKWGIAHSLCLGLAPWLAAEVPSLVGSGAVSRK
jgi:ufm1-conjugating enzyme 1